MGRERGGIMSESWRTASAGNTDNHPGTALPGYCLHGGKGSNRTKFIVSISGATLVQLEYNTQLILKLWNPFRRSERLTLESKRNQVKYRSAERRKRSGVPRNVPRTVFRFDFNTTWHTLFSGTSNKQRLVGILSDVRVCRKSKMAAINRKCIGNNVYLSLSSWLQDGYTHVFGVRQHGETSGKFVRRPSMSEIKDGGY